MWKDVAGYEGCYQISDKTVVKSLKRQRCRKERILKQKKDMGGYLYVRLYKNGKRQRCLVHRLMLEAFIGPCPEGYQTCHNNGDKENNLIPNIRWDTPYNNTQDKIKHATNFIKARGIKSGMAKLNELQVRIIKHLLKEGKLSQREIAEIFGVSCGTISLINNNKTWKHVSID